MTDHAYYMRQALLEAQKAADLLEVPIGAVVVCNGQIIGRGHNVRESQQAATGHAELLAIQEANKNLGAWRLEDCSLYVTLEPCPMCSGAIILSRLKAVIYGAKDEKAGTCGTLMNLVQDQRFNHQAQVISGVLEADCQALLKDFFKSLRQRNKAYPVKIQASSRVKKQIQELWIYCEGVQSTRCQARLLKAGHAQPFGLRQVDFKRLCRKYAGDVDLAAGLLQMPQYEFQALGQIIQVQEAGQKVDFL